MSFDEDALALHESARGKIAVVSKIPLASRRDLSLAYTPGVAAVSSAIAADRKLAYRYTIKQNSVAIVSDGSAVLGLGDIGPEAALPVMEGKCVLMKSLAGIDAFPLCIDVHDADGIVSVVKAVAPVFGAINLEDIAAPKCFEIEERLKAELDIPVMHDDQHATAVVVLAALINALKVVNKEKERLKVVISGAGAAATATARMLLSFGVRDVILVDSKGAVYSNRGDLNHYKEALAAVTNNARLSGSLASVMRGADVLIGLSKGNIVSGEMVKSMASSPIIFAMANPVPEIMPDTAKSAGAAVVGTGRSDFPNQINNSLAFPGIFRGALDCHASAITEGMKLAAAYAIASLVKAPSAEMVVPEPLDSRIVPAVSAAVAAAKD
ncbi:NADP-dependent malic enzyme [Candidatus Woesearchaeota archaeon]|nr:NADP-dependent malic enzyme [Candidatus Woesearchaeota archaeon]